MQTIVYGLCSVITNNQPMGGYKQSYLTVASGTLGPIPFLAIFALIVGIFFWFLYNKTRHGKYMYAIGGNENAAQVAGVNVSGVLVGVLVFEVLKICLQFLGVDPAYTYIAQGLVIVIAVALDLRKYLAKK